MLPNFLLNIACSDAFEALKPLNQSYPQALPSRLASAHLTGLIFSESLWSGAAFWGIEMIKAGPSRSMWLG